MGHTWDLLLELTLTDFRLKYKNSVLGFFWSLLKPLLSFLVLYVVFFIFIRLEIEHYELYLLLGIFLWNYIADCSTAGLNSIVSKANLIKKANFARGIIVLSACLSATVTFVLNLLVFFLFVFTAGILPTWTVLVFFYLVFFLFIFLLGLSLLLATGYVYFRDLSHLWDVLLQLLFWLSPIIYSLGFIPQKYHALYLLNPLTQYILMARQILIFNEVPALSTLTFVALVSLLMLLVGYLVFSQKSPLFAEEL